MVVPPFIGFSCSVVMAFALPTTRHTARPSSRFARTFASTKKYEVGQCLNDEPDRDRDRRQVPNQRSYLKAQPSFLLVQTAAMSNRLGTGVGVSFVGSFSEANSSSNHGNNVAANNTATSFGVYFPQHRSPYERAYTALIVALQWLQKNNAISTNHQPMVTLLIHQDVVYHQLLGNYPVEKESLKTLNRIAINLIQASHLDIKLELSPKAAPFQGCNELASRVLLIEQSDKGFHAFIDPLDPYSSVTSSDEEFVELEDRVKGDDDNDVEFNLALESPKDCDASMQVCGASMESKPSQAVSSESQTRPEIDPNRTYLLQFDGGARGNPYGPSGCGVVIYDEERKKVWTGAKYLGVNMTNNQAEYTGIVLGLQHANAMGIRKLRCQGDSLLIIQQLKGHYKVKNEGLKPYHQAAVKAISEFDFFEAHHIVRKDNAVADSLANQAMDCKTSFGF